MTRLAGVLRDAAAILAKAEARWALVGGLAVSARTEPRFTRDADIAVSVGSDTEAEDLVRRFGQAGYGIKAVVEQEAQDRVATARLLPPGEPEEGLVLDLLFASSGIEPELVAAADVLEVFSGLTLPVATTGYLLALKLLSRDDETRPQDGADLRALVAVATDRDTAVAREAGDLVSLRGFARGRDLGRDLQELLARRLG